MEVIYYMRNYYPLTAAQKMHHNWIMDYGTQQVSGVSVVASVQAGFGNTWHNRCWLVWL